MRKTVLDDNKGVEMDIGGYLGKIMRVDLTRHEVTEEPEYEQIAAWGPVIGNTDLGAVVMLAREVDRLGMDCNESYWIVAWLMECRQKGALMKNDLDGIEMSWGNVEAVIPN